MLIHHLDGRIDVQFINKRTKEDLTIPLEIFILIVKETKNEGQFLEEIHKANEKLKEIKIRTATHNS